jgi:hypothetical protein
MTNDKKSGELKTIVFGKDGTTKLMELKGQPYGQLPLGTIVTISEGVTAKCTFLSNTAVGFTIL